MPKIIVENMNEGREGELLLWEIAGAVPSNFIMNAPDEAELIEDLDIDLENGTALINNSKKSARLSAEASNSAINIANKEALHYLASTDWYIIRELDNGEPCPQEIKDARAAARAVVLVE